MTARATRIGHPGTGVKATAQAGRPVFARLGSNAQSNRKNRQRRAPGPICAGMLHEWAGAWHALPLSRRAADEVAAFLGQSTAEKNGEKDE
jgi:hypothetical protein